MTDLMKPTATASVQEWQEKEFLPWKAAMAKYQDERGQQVAQMKSHAGDLQTIVAMLVEGRTKQAMLTWNTLQLHPKLKDLRVSGDGESVTMVAVAGRLTVVRLDDVIADLAALLKS